jgi:muramidase (phage lysozyme)
VTNRQAFLDTLAVSEIGVELLLLSDNGYNVCVGSTPAHPILFESYATHPRLRCDAVNSDAAGRYQFMGRFWPFYQRELGLTDFGHESQDRWAIQLIRECHALEDVDAGRFDQAILACKSRWASLPGAGYGQHENKLGALRDAYLAAGGVLA